MARMIKMEAVVFARYFKQLALTMAFTMACVAIGMGTISADPLDSVRHDDVQRVGQRLGL